MSFWFVLWWLLQRTPRFLGWLVLIGGTAATVAWTAMQTEAAALLAEEGMKGMVGGFCVGLLLALLRLWGGH